MPSSMLENSSNTAQPDAVFRREPQFLVALAIRLSARVDINSNAVRFAVPLFFTIPATLTLVLIGAVSLIESLVRTISSSGQPLPKPITENSEPKSPPSGLVAITFPL